MKIEIIGYDIVNGDKQTHKVFKNNIVSDVEQVDNFEKRIKSRYEKSTTKKFRSSLFTKH